MGIRMLVEVGITTIDWSVSLRYVLYACSNVFAATSGTMCATGAENGRVRWARSARWRLALGSGNGPAQECAGCLVLRQAVALAGDLAIYYCTFVHLADPDGNRNRYIGTACGGCKRAREGRVDSTDKRGNFSRPAVSPLGSRKRVLGDVQAQRDHPAEGASSIGCIPPHFTSLCRRTVGADGGIVISTAHLCV